MQEGISVLAAILWAVASGLVGVGIGICIMCLMFVARRADDASPPRLPKTVYMADYLKGKSAKENQ
jgi:MFS superfamily sulfate permease-like transporter